MAYSGSSRDGTVIQGTALDTKPKSLMMALSEIEQFSYAEKSSHIPVEALTSVTLMSFFNVGFIYAIKSSLFSALLSPPLLMVERNLLPIFGNTTPSFYDKIFAYALTFSLPLTFALFIAYIFQKSLSGELTRKTMAGITWGLVGGKFFSTFVIWILLNIIYTSIFTKKHIISAISWFYNKQWSLPWSPNSVYHWLLAVRDSIIDSTLIIIITNTLFIAIILLSIALGKYNDKRYKKFIEEWL